MKHKVGKRFPRCTCKRCCITQLTKALFATGKYTQQTARVIAKDLMK